MAATSLPAHRFAPGEQLLELCRLLRDAVGCAVVIGVSRKRSRLLDQLANIVAQHGNAVVEFGSGEFFSMRISSGL
jgi:hypothetical protein